MSETYKNLAEAFAGESQANRKYLAFAEKADAEGYPQIARLFRAVAHAETIHAHNHLRAMAGIHSTEENLKEAINGENHEAVSMYPPFLETAKAEGDTRAARSFEYALEVEKVHAALYSAALENLGKETGEYDYYVCPVCGYTHARTAPDKCPVCGLPGAKFEVVH